MNESDDLWNVSSWDYPEPDGDGIPHGKRNGYQNHGCRGPKCRAAQNEYMKDYRAGRAARRVRLASKHYTTAA